MKRQTKWEEDIVEIIQTYKGRTFMIYLSTLSTGFYGNIQYKIFYYL